jgi:hypothetical protein
MTAAKAEDSSGGQQRWQMTMTATVDNDSGRQQRRRRTAAGKIGWQTTRGKEEIRRQTTPALDKRLISPPGRECEKINKSSLRKKTYFSNTACPVVFFAPPKTANVPF